MVFFLGGGVGFAWEILPMVVANGGQGIRIDSWHIELEAICTDRVTNLSWVSWDSFQYERPMS